MSVIYKFSPASYDLEDILQKDENKVFRPVIVHRIQSFYFDCSTILKKFPPIDISDKKFALKVLRLLTKNTQDGLSNYVRSCYCQKENCNLCKNPQKITPEILSFCHNVVKTIYMHFFTFYKGKKYQKKRQIKLNKLLKNNNL